MFEATNGNGEIVFAANIEAERRSKETPEDTLGYIKEVKASGLMCIPGEGENQHRVHFRSASRRIDGTIKKVPHFAHYKGCNHDHHNGGSQREHDDRLYMIYQLLQDEVQGKMVIKGRLGDRVANLHFFHDQQHYALEYEHSPFSEEQMLEKVTDYSAKGLATIFVLNQDLLDTNSAEAVIRHFGVAYFHDDADGKILWVRPSTYMDVSDLKTSSLKDKVKSMSESLSNRRMIIGDVEKIDVYSVASSAILGFLGHKSAAYLRCLKPLFHDDRITFDFMVSPGGSFNQDRKVDVTDIVSTDMVHVYKRQLLECSNFHLSEISRTAKVMVESRKMAAKLYGEKVFTLTIKDIVAVLAKANGVVVIQGKVALKMTNYKISSSLDVSVISQDMQYLNELRSMYHVKRHIKESMMAALVVAGRIITELQDGRGNNEKITAIRGWLRNIDNASKLIGFDYNVSDAEIAMLIDLYKRRGVIK